MTVPIIIQKRLEELGRGEKLYCPNCHTVLYGFNNLRPDLTAADFAALKTQLGEGANCLHARWREAQICFPGVALDRLPDEYIDEFICRELL
jgi:hypothetical protein